uniref:Uncharacterized protein n=1 Tax=Arundo donax TaxID=35708 RepID=A0A0A9R2W0_ARUDO
MAEASDPSHGGARYRTRKSSPAPTRAGLAAPRLG